jgi:hypothetical protein
VGEYEPADACLGGHQPGLAGEVRTRGELMQLERAIEHARTIQREDRAERVRRRMYRQ